MNWPFLSGCHLSVFHQTNCLTQHKSCSGRTGRFQIFIQDFSLGGTHVSEARWFGPGRNDGKSPRRTEVQTKCSHKVNVRVF